MLHRPLVTDGIDAEDVARLPARIAPHRVIELSAARRLP